MWFGGCGISLSSHYVGWWAWYLFSISCSSVGVASHDHLIMQLGGCGISSCHVVGWAWYLITLCGMVGVASHLLIMWWGWYFITLRGWMGVASHAVGCVWCSVSVWPADADHGRCTGAEPVGGGVCVSSSGGGGFVGPDGVWPIGVPLLGGRSAGAAAERLQGNAPLQITWPVHALRAASHWLRLCPTGGRAGPPQALPAPPELSHNPPGAQQHHRHCPQRRRWATPTHSHWPISACLRVTWPGMRVCVCKGDFYFDTDALELQSCLIITTNHLHTRLNIH